MGPLFLPGNEWYLVASFLIGIAFGFVLEQAGFSSSKKLAGVFYGYDFVVMRVFFTAAITAMLGLLYFGYLGWIDMDKIFINSTYVYSAIVGGVIMGFGFVIGGFCPGTSVCAIGIGKIDAMVFVGGIFIGVFIFAEAYPLYESFYNGHNLGPIKVFDSLGISESLFAFLLIVIALGMFYATFLIEKKVSKTFQDY
jgi:uncharacterized protein